jgi:hypothetical protein
MTEAKQTVTKPLAVALLAASLFVAGCAAVQTSELVNTARPDAQLMVDTEFCRVEAEAKLPKPHGHPSTVELTGLAALITIFERRSLENQYQAEVNAAISECLRAKGWKPK